ncbi:MAG: ice-binding family protein [Ferruginibacter sp.]
MKKKVLHLATIVTLFISPSICLAQAPTLGFAGDFVLFTTAGPVTNTPISHLTGNVGTNSGSNTGFGNVNGVMHAGDGVSGQAAADLLVAYDQLKNATATFFPAPLLGNGDTLVAGVYKVTGVTTLSSTLYLDAKGNSNAVFIFQIQAAFSSTAGAKVKLLNGAQSCNVFWKVEGAVNLATATFMRGTIVANNAAIGMSTNDTLEGRALSINGAITLDGVTGYIPPGCGKAQLTGPIAPNLGSTACYAVFSGNGSVVNSGVSTITGDVGTNVGLTTGFNPLTVNGTVHPIPDGSTAAAAADLLVAYNYLNVLPHQIELLYPAQFGRNLVLTPHTYIMNGATTFTDSLYLNAEGNTSAVFVLKLKGALTTSTLAKVILINGTQASNVYWMVDGAVNINGNSIFNGTIVCNSGAINLATGVTINGRALTTGGALSSTSSMSVFSPSGDCRPLPVSWLYFRGKPAQKNVLVEWGTTKEVNNGFFTLEKSRDGQNFESLTTVNASKGIESAAYNYSFTDQNPYSLNYYRISQTDRDGKKNTYNTIQVKANVDGGLKTLHYVRQDYIYVQMTGAVPGDATIELYTIDGKKMSSQKIILTREANVYKIAKPVRKGIYLLSIQAHGEKLYHGKIML